MEPSYAPHATAPQVERLEAIFAKQRSAYSASPFPVAAERIASLNKLKRMLLDNRDAITKAVSADFGSRSVHETLALEVFPSVEGINQAKGHLKSWMKPRSTGTGIWFMPARNRVIPQPLGVVGVIVPWNYPIFLAIGPLTAALAAGNRAIIKMSEFTPQTGELLSVLIRKYFDEDQIAVINGGPEVAQAFSAKPFDHLLFTGSTAVGKHVMRAAAENLTPVTLELGGKSPTIIGPEFPVDLAAQRIMWGKCLNAGQTCVAPDYVMVPTGKEQAFVDAARVEVGKLYPKMASNGDYTAVVNQRHYARLQGYLDDARAKGATIVELLPAGESLAGSGKIAPTLVMNATDDMRIMQEEIFGPLMPVRGYQRIEEAIKYVNDHGRPLALYYFEYDGNRIERMMQQTISGGVSINETVLHVGQESLPFGGVGPSGMGHYHGKWGFDTFSKQKGVFIQSRLNGVGLLKPPYGPAISALLKLMLR